MLKKLISPQTATSQRKKRSASYRYTFSTNNSPVNHWCLTVQSTTRKESSLKPLGAPKSLRPSASYTASCTDSSTYPSSTTRGAGHSWPPNPPPIPSLPLPPSHLPPPSSLWRFPPAFLLNLPLYPATAAPSSTSPSLPYPTPPSHTLSEWPPL